MLVQQPLGSILRSVQVGRSCRRSLRVFCLFAVTKCGDFHLVQMAAPSAFSTAPRQDQRKLVQIPWSTRSSELATSPSSRLRRISRVRTANQGCPVTESDLRVQRSRLNSIRRCCRLPAGYRVQGRAVSCSLPS